MTGKAARTLAMLSAMLGAGVSASGSVVGDSVLVRWKANVQVEGGSFLLYVMSKEGDVALATVVPAAPGEHDYVFRDGISWLDSRSSRAYRLVYRSDDGRTAELGMTGARPTLRDADPGTVPSPAGRDLGDSLDAPSLPRLEGSAAAVLGPRRPLAPTREIPTPPPEIRLARLG